MLLKTRCSPGTVHNGPGTHSQSWPSTFKSRLIEREETVHQDTGLLGFTTKHIYFSGPKKKFRVRYDKIVDFEPYDDGLGIMNDNQTAKPQAFRTGDGWFSFNLAVNLAQI